ncbi:hypothetical protein SKAU_G00321400 [Synaphobranchus kaupii]|uniref:Uncharacterized protein n=1 Tax=Synaphobranchus kaupii TaxID=118154 RepID=A0A9Q1IJL0_SYNKA|nr:hypothetical protein SKAU_G00321400 [Synaphobranchus kaupii]
MAAVCSVSGRLLQAQVQEDPSMPERPNSPGQVMHLRVNQPDSPSPTPSMFLSAEGVETAPKSQTGRINPQKKILASGPVRISETELVPPPPIDLCSRGDTPLSCTLAHRQGPRPPYCTQGQRSQGMRR